MGVVDLASAILSHPPERLLALRHLVPSLVRDSSRTFTLLAGCLLLVTAWGLRRGKRRAFVAAMALCAVSVPVNLLKAMDLEEATVATALLFALGVSAEAFQVRSREWSFAMLRSRAMWAVLALFAYAVTGSWWLERQYGVPLSLFGTLDDSIDRLFGIGRPLEIPNLLPHPAAHVLGWYLRSLPLLGVTLVVGLALAALRPARHAQRHRTEARRVEALIREYGGSSVSWFALSDDADYFWSRNRRAVLAYRFEADAVLVIGDPLGPAEEWRPLLAEFSEFCRLHDWPFAFFQARPELLPLYESFGWRAFHIGEDPVLWTARFTLVGSAVGSVRRAVRHAEGAGLRVTHLLPGERPPADSALPPQLWEQLRAVSGEWLRTRKGGEKGFCMGRFEPQRLRQVWVAIAWDPATHRVEGFTTWVPIPARQGWALDLMRRREDAPNGTMDLLVVRSLEVARERGDALLSLSLSALASVPTPSAEIADERAPGVNNSDRAREFLQQHLARFYDFQGVFRWKRRFDPAFEDRYLVHPGPGVLPHVVWALIRAQSPGGLASYLRPPAARSRETVTPLTLAPGKEHP
jgi:phosphatidylglycerol lysyltransferase